MKRHDSASSPNLRGDHGSTFVVVLGFVAVLSVTFGAVLSRTMNTHRKVSHIASWQEALIAADAGAETAVSELRATINDTTAGKAFVGWEKFEDINITQDSTSLGTVGANQGKEVVRDHLGAGKALRFMPPKLVHGGEGNTEMEMTVTIDAPPSLKDLSGKQWFRVRSTGTTYLPGANLMAGDRRDLRLRRMSFHRDGKLKQNVTRPQTSRTVEMIVKPIGLEPALFSREAIELGNANITINSYDSRTSYDHLYHDSVAGAEGDVATNSKLINAGGANIFGDAFTNDGVVAGSENVKGEIDNEYFLDVDSIVYPSSYAIPAPTGYTLINSNTLTGAPTIAGTKDAPKRLKLSGSGGLSISGNDLVFEPNPVEAAAIPPRESYVEVWAPGDLVTTGNGSIVVKPGVNVKIYVEGNIRIGGNGNWNANSQPARLQIFGVQYQGTGAPPAVTVSGNGIIVAAIYAPDHPIEFKATGSGGQVWGSIFGKSIIMGGATHIHYDRALAEAGRTTDFRIKTWFEDNSY